MREFASPSLSLAGSLLIAHPSLLDRNFRKSVLFISTNDTQEGSFGLTLNRPAGRTVGELLPGRELGVLGNVPVFLGGPVSGDQLIFASFKWHSQTERLECNHHLVIDEAEECLKDESIVVRAFVGYAGWGPGQLESELESGSWLITGPTVQQVLHGGEDELWNKLITRVTLGGRIKTELIPDDPSVN